MGQTEIEAVMQVLNSLKQFSEQMAVNQAIEIARLRLRVAELEKPPKEE